MPTTHPPSPDRDLLDAQAFELVETHRRTPGPESLAALNAFRSRSSTHASAVRQAEQFLDLPRQIQRPRRTFFLQSVWFRLDLWWTRFAEHRVAASAAIAVLAGITTLWVLANRSEYAAPAIAAVESTAETFSTGWRQQRELVLSDGSTVWLGWQTALAVELTPTQRHVSLSRGVAAFKVTGDPHRPFFVSAGSVRTRVTGTEFVVSRQHPSHVEVAVLEGQVKVLDPATGEATLNAAQTVSVNDGAMSAVTRRSPGEIGQWRDGMLVFNDRPLLDALSALAPYTRYQLDTSEIAGHSGLVSGVFFIDQADEALLTVLQAHRIQTDNAGGNRLRLRHARPQRP